VLFAIGVEVQGSEARNVGTIPYAALMGAMAVGLWRARYWAVLGFQTLLALLIVIWSLLLVRAESAVGALLAIAIVALAGTMFWFLVKALARIQMPDRRPPRGGQ
jgi:steroid 5-alpha reductase family enzyme